MEYSISKLSDMAGVSTRTLRYYDEIDLLKPKKINSSGYRIYGKMEVDRLQIILFYRELGLSLENIKGIILSPTFDEVNALKEHRDKLLKKRKRLDILISNVNKTITSKERSIIMNDSEKFKGFKEKLINDNEKKYGTEARKKYGDESVNRSNNKLKNMNKDEYDKVTKLSDEVIKTLDEAFKTGDPGSKLAQRAAKLHKEWLSYYWDKYNSKAHANLAQMYVDDERFRAYYDKNQPGTAKFLRDAIFIYTGIEE